MESALKRNSRFSNKPAKRLDGSTFIIDRPSECDLAIFKALSHYHYLDNDYLAALTGYNAEYVLNRLDPLKRKPNNYVALAEEQAANPRAHLISKLMYRLDKRGAAAVKDVFYRAPLSSSFSHDVVNERCLASLEIGTIERPEIKARWPEDILAYEKTPEATRSSPSPFVIPVSFQKNGETINAKVTPDTKLFGFERTHLPKGKFVFGVLETDRGTEAIDPKDFERSGINRKAIEYIEIHLQELYRSQFGVPNLYIFFVAMSERRKQSIMAIIERQCRAQNCQQLLKFFCFKVHPDLYASEKPRATGHMLTEPWERIKNAPFYITGQE
jgi:hypothetical protein